MVSPAAFDPGHETYVNLATFRRDGREVRTPIWIAGTGGRYVAFSEGSAGKVKRLRNNGRARLAACNARGAVRSDWIEARGRILADPDEIDEAHRLLRAKYRWQMGIGDLFSKLTGRYGRRAWLEVSTSTPEGEDR